MNQMGKTPNQRGFDDSVKRAHIQHTKFMRGMNQRQHQWVRDNQAGSLRHLRKTSQQMLKGPEPGRQIVVDPPNLYPRTWESGDSGRVLDEFSGVRPATDRARTPGRRSPGPILIGIVLTAIVFLALLYVLFEVWLRL
jgi:hypothetical protein